MAEENNSEKTMDEQTEGMQKQPDGKKDKKKKSPAREVFEWVYSIAIAVAVALLIKGFVFDIVLVDGDSMIPTLHDRERLIVTKLGYKPQAGDVIILDCNYDNREAEFDRLANAQGKEELSGVSKFFKTLTLKEDNLKKKYYVKRVIATEGQTVDIHDGKVYVDGKGLDEPYIQGITTPHDSPSDTTSLHVTVEEDHVFVLGDNREHSSDSRMIGQIDEDAILGKAQIRVFPFNKMSKIK